MKNPILPFIRLYRILKACIEAEKLLKS